MSEKNKHNEIEQSFPEGIEVTELMKILNENGDIDNQKLEKLKKSKKQKANASLTTSSDKTNYSALELYNFKTTKIPRLLDPFLQLVGLASLVGTSDSGKSTFLRQLSISIVLENETFLGYELKPKHKKVIFVSTEDDSNSISYSIRKQIDGIIAKNDNVNIENLNNLDFIFDTTELLSVLESKLKHNPVDLIVIDAFTDVFTKEINANTQVRTFLNQYDKLAKKYGCLIIFLHHTGKRTQKNEPSKDNIIGSQAFEAKMRSVLELRPKGKHTALWVLKSNFLESKYKKTGQLLELDNNTLLFENSNIVAKKLSGTKSNNPEIIKRVLELKEKDVPLRKIAEQLTNEGLSISKSTVETICKNQQGENKMGILKRLRLQSEKK
ncbi:hypothetical protein D6T69_13330 [Tenacibaculum singaporense]|uniref:AAA domain-containing protein n=1 Tax=Tenacibaculum singaporense TaxID=2358479 RepID=A0A3S8R9J0_9FLAO|nr:AAA family ATPase [Tenacibaculum singaporense]AZJ36450.1 hypothetical protein D6T69_13330 [Tenacibaculum singaporense]